MKKVFLTLIVAALVSVTVISCEKQKGCVCYAENDQQRTRLLYDIATEEECIIFTAPLVDSIYLQCGWEKW